MRDERFEVRMSFDERRGYVASAPELRSAVGAQPGGLRHKIEALRLPDEVRVVLQHDGLAREGTSSAAGVGAAKQNCAA